jgi:dinuclear metal center YbgI/SA1388 family protein
MTIKDITNYIEELAPLQYAEDFDNVGLLIGNFTNKITGVLVTLDTLEETIDEAIAKKCNLIISFHPIIFSGLKKITGSNYVERVVLKAIKNDIAIYSMHTALDNVSNGVSAEICNVLGVKNYQTLIPQQDKPTIGMGMIGELDKAMSEADFMKMLKDKMHVSCIRHSNLLGKTIKKVAVLGGSGSFGLKNAIQQGADVYISADFKYHEFYQAEKQLIIMDIGHYESEQFTKNLIVAYLNKKFSTFAVILSEEITNPINYF